MKHKNDDEILKNKGTYIYSHYKVYLNLQKIFFLLQQQHMETGWKDMIDTTLDSIFKHKQH